MLSKIISGAVCLAIAVSPVTASGAVLADASPGNFMIENATATEDGLYYTVYEDHVEITGYDESVGGEIIIPGSIGGLPVTHIGNRAFYACSALKSVIISEGVTSIGDDAFMDCLYLTSVIIPDSVADIGFSIFSRCNSLSEIHVDPENPYYMDVDGVLFSKDQKILLKYPPIKSDQSYSVPDSVTNIAIQAFYGCSSLESVMIPDSVTSIGGGAFAECWALKSITIPESITSIAEGTFSHCSLKSIMIPDNITSIGECAFAESSLQFVTISDNVTTIGAGAFEWCPLESVIIPGSVRNIGNLAFSGCEVLESITIQNPDCEIDDDEYTIYKTAVIYGYPDSTAQAYAEKYNRQFVALGENLDNSDNSEILWGDANSDGTVDISDVVLMNRVCVGVDEITPDGLTNSDVDQSGKLELADSMNVLRLLVHLLGEDDFPIQSES